MKFAVFLLAASASAAFAAAPVVSGLSLSADDAGDVTVSYSVDADAIVTYAFTLDGEELSGETVVKVSGGIGVPVAANTPTSFLWRASLDMPDMVIDTARLGVKLHAYGVSNPPPYAVANLIAGPVPIRYYSSTNELPGGLFANDMYRTTRMVFKRVYAKNVKWLMGSTAQGGRTASNEKAHFVTMDHDYYLAVFEWTKGQLSAMYNGLKSSGKSENNTPERWMFKPVENSLLSYLRGDGAEPAEGTALGMARAVTGLAFDFPSESEWEFAARAGYSENNHNDGSPYHASNTNEFILALANFNTNVSFEVGSFKPSDWGFYDMLGNGGEVCIDYYQSDISGNHDGTPNVSSEDPSKCRDGVTETVNRVMKGGYWANTTYAALRPAYRESVNPTTYNEKCSFRLRLPCPIK